MSSKLISTSACHSSTKLKIGQIQDRHLTSGTIIYTANLKKNAITGSNSRRWKPYHLELIETTRPGYCVLSPQKLRPMCVELGWPHPRKICLKSFKKSYRGKFNPVYISFNSLSLSLSLICPCPYRLLVFFPGRTYKVFRGEKQLLIRPMQWPVQNTWSDSIADRTMKLFTWVGLLLQRCYVLCAECVYVLELSRVCEPSEGGWSITPRFVFWIFSVGKNWI